MNATLSLLLLLFKASLLALGASLSPALDPRCPAKTSISGANEVATITTVQDGWDSREAVLYVHPDLGFKGVLIEVAGDGWTVTVSFTMDNTCFPQHDGVWWWLMAGVLRKMKKNNALDIYGAIGDCKLHCPLNYSVPGDLSLNIEALGPSRLRFTDPDSCTTIKNPSGDYITVNCTKPPEPKTPTTNNNTYTTTTTPTSTTTTTTSNNNNNNNNTTTTTPTSTTTTNTNTNNNNNNNNNNNTTTTNNNNNNNTTTNTPITTITTTTTTLSPALDQRCPADTTISLAKEWVNTTTVQTWGHVHQKVLYVHPDPNFKGVRLVATGDGWRRAAWFTLDNTCFPQDADWWQLWINVERKWRNVNPFLTFKLMAGKCSFQCYGEGHFTGDMNVNIEAQGPSRWRLEDPEPCSVVNNVQQRFSTIECAEPRVPKIITITSTTSKTTTSPKMTGAVTAVVVLVVIIVLVGGVSVVVVAKRRIRQGRLRVKSWNWLAACWGVGGQVVDGDNHKETPMVPKVLPHMRPWRGLAASSANRGEAADINQVKPPIVPTVHPRVPPRRGLAASWAVRGEAADDNNHAAPPRVEIAAPASYHHQSKNVDDDDDDYLTPRRAPPGTPSGVTEGEEPIYEEIATPAFSRQSKNVDDDDDDYLTPRRAPQGTTSWVTKEEEPIYDELYVPAHYRQ
ncbi:uncharacterized protein LOC126996794 [Eriocheir sinensis]|uniref:uncharacterized protein LOC126996794 n=1 Tax=Eriocheir sinensis TaxID=95602 RepID=UPI0021C7B9AA|nr:uncharacterized protein LOC126996794 [Eriocheir sinensis]